MSIKRKLTGIIAGLIGSASIAQAEAEHTLVISSWVPPTHMINTEILTGLNTLIEEATDGRVTTEIRMGIAPPPAQMDLVLDGAADIAYVFHGYQPGRFTGYKLVELPRLEASSEDVSAAYWNLHENHLSKLNEHRGVKVVGLMVHGPGQLHTGSPVDSLDQMSGLKLRMPGGVASDVGALLNATGIKVPAPKVYETLASNAADGVMMVTESRKSFRLTEVAPHYYTVPGGFFRGSFAFIMNEDIFADLPDDLQAALNEKVFGAPLSSMSGKAWDAADVEALALTAATEGNTSVEASTEDLAKFDTIAAQVETSVLDEVSAKGIDAQAALADFRAELGLQ
ncbi:MAG: TRAP transporter substrate-binding protein [Cognatishimia sp.]|uniref:TRAP transporter substrate-binding protein n=1 Tax=Cognatishimia sp. TaxID=2211648 RepID=UPI003B8D0BC3